MPEEENASNGEHTEETAGKPKVRRISNKAPRKPAAKKTEKEASPEPVDAEAPGTAEESGKTEQKRSNRRRRGKGKPSGQDLDQGRGSEAAAADETEAQPQDSDSEKKGNKPATRDQTRNAQRPAQKPRHKLDSGKVAKHAWKIYLAEVSEEGVALIGDNDARELVRRCFRLSEIFLEEEDRRN
jgi:hypothetical protein